MSCFFSCLPLWNIIYLMLVSEHGHSFLGALLPTKLMGLIGSRVFLMLARIWIHPQGHPRVVQIHGLCWTRAHPGCAGQEHIQAVSAHVLPTPPWGSLGHLKLCLWADPPSMELFSAASPSPTGCTNVSSRKSPETAEVPPTSSSPCSVSIKAI